MDKAALVILSNQIVIMNTLRVILTDVLAQQTYETGKTPRPKKFLVALRRRAKKTAEVMKEWASEHGNLEHVDTAAFSECDFAPGNGLESIVLAEGAPAKCILNHTGLSTKGTAQRLVTSASLENTSESNEVVCQRQTIKLRL